MGGRGAGDQQAGYADRETEAQILEGESAYCNSKDKPVIAY